MSVLEGEGANCEVGSDRCNKRINSLYYKNQNLCLEKVFCREPTASQKAIRRLIILLYCFRQRGLCHSPLCSFEPCHGYPHRSNSFHRNTLATFRKKMSHPLISLRGLLFPRVLVGLQCQIYCCWEISATCHGILSMKPL